MLRHPGIRALLRILAHIALFPVGALFYVCRVRFFNPELLNARVGHMAYEPDLYLKTHRIGWRKPDLALWLCPPGASVNPCLVEYWSRLIHVVRNPALAAVLRPWSMLKYLRPRYDRFDHLPVRHRNQVFLAAQREYEVRCGGVPLLKLTAEHRARGRAALHEMGVPSDAWYVCVHVRETGADPNLPARYRLHLENPGQSFRDADVTSYIPAMEEIVRRGGWVVRMGDPSMTRLPTLKNVIDYAHSAHRSDWMDVFLCAEARFFLGTTSGLYLVPFIFGVPCAIANVVPLDAAPLSSRDVYVPKMHFQLAEQRPLTFAEVCSLDIAEAYHGAAFERVAVRLIETSPEDIRSAAIEMIVTLEGAAAPSKTDEARQRRYRDVLRARGRVPTSAAVARDFLERHEELLQSPC